jgi:hypothetical protein
MSTKIEIFVTDENGDRELINDLYWFEENGVHSFDEAEGHWGEKYEFEIYVNGLKTYPSTFDSDSELQELLKKYIATIDNGDDEEYFMTMREFAQWQIEPFLDWLESNRRLEKINGLKVNPLEELEKPETNDFPTILGFPITEKQRKKIP